MLITRADQAAPAAPAAPVIVAISGAAVARDGFELAQLGVGEFVEKPFTTGRLAPVARSAGAGPARDDG